MNPIPAGTFGTAPQHGGRSVRRPATRLVAALLLATLTACGGGSEPGQNGSPDAASPPQHRPVCDDASEGIELAEEGWSVTRTEGDETWIDYAAVFALSAPESITAVDIRVTWFDAAGDPLGWGPETGEEYLRQELSAHVVGDQAVISDFLWTVGDVDRIEYTIIGSCRTPGEPAPAVAVENTTVEVTGDAGEITVEVHSDADLPATVEATAVFRDASGSIIGGTAASADGLTITDVPPGQSTHTVSFGWERFYPDVSDIDSVELYAAVV